jgi:hypothetical protein
MVKSAAAFFSPPPPLLVNGCWFEEEGGPSNSVANAGQVRGLKHKPFAGVGTNRVPLLSPAAAPVKALPPPPPELVGLLVVFFATGFVVFAFPPRLDRAWWLELLAKPLARPFARPSGLPITNGSAGLAR